MSAFRTLFFTEEGVFWQCNKAKASECESEFTNISPGLNKGYPTLREISTDIKGSVGNAVSTGTVAVLGWSELLEIYSKKALTMPTDRLPALLGMGIDMARLSGAKFNMGILKIHLIEGLDWCIGRPLHERPATRQMDIPT
jgi:hypothetical protein